MKRRTGEGMILAAVMAALGGAIPGSATAQSQGKALAATPAIEQGPSTVDLLNKALNPGSSDPDVPLPHPNLTVMNADRSSSKTQVFGRPEQGGGVFGLRVAIPADRSSSGASTRYSSVP